MKYRKGILGVFLTSTFLAGCGGGGDSVQPPKKIEETIVQVSGAVQKGPFVTGTKVTANLLTSDAENTESTIVTNITDDLGRFSFSLSEAKLIELSATGYYLNEITGELSQGTLTLRSIHYLSEDEKQIAYVNILTHLTNQRIKSLLSRNSRFEDAKNQAETEFLTTFNEVVPNSAENSFNTLSIYNDELSSGSAYLLTVSSILYKYALDQSIVNSTNPYDELTLVINTLEVDFGGNGIINSTDILQSLRETIPSINPKDISNNIGEWIDGVSGFELIDINEYLDTDLDGIFNIFDNDDDNDGIEDEIDTSPYQPSFIIANQSLSVEEDETIDINIETNNPKDMEIVVKIISSPSNGGVIGTYPTLNYAPNTHYSGNDSFSYMVKQGEILSEIATINLDISEVNDAPVITGSPVIEFVAHNEYSFIPAISDIENDSLVLSIEHLPTWASFNEATGEIYGTPTNDNVGLYENITISVSDGDLTATPLSFDINVLVNPYELGFTVSNQNIEVIEDGSISIDVSSNNPLNTDIELTIIQNPSFGSIHGQYPELTYLPNENYSGMDTIKYQLSQDVIISGDVTITINILPVNDSPTISGTPNNSITAFETFLFVPTTSDIDEDELEFSIQNLPSWASFDGMTGEISGSPDNEDVGIYQDILISVSDGELYVELEIFQIEVIGKPWVTSTSLSRGRHSPAAAAIGSQIFLTGGFPTESLLEVYDSEGGTWELKSNLINPRRSHSAHVINEELFVVGGEYGSLLNSVERYNSSINSWEELEPMNTARSSHAGCVYEGNIFVFGGFINRNPSTATNIVEMYDPVNNSWEYKTPMPISNRGMSCATVGDKIYVFGGAESSQEYVIYDPLLDNWSEGGNLNSPKYYGFATEVIGDLVYLIGGHTAEPTNWISDKVEILDTSTGTWSLKTSMPTPRYDIGHALIDGRIIIIGGRNSSSNGLTIVEEYINTFEF